MEEEPPEKAWSRLCEVNPHLTLVKNMVQHKQGEAEFDRLLAISPASKIRILDCALNKECGNIMLGVERYERAIQEYTKGAAVLLGMDPKSDSSQKLDLFNLEEEGKTMFNKICKGTDSNNMQAFLLLVSYCFDVGYCWLKSNDRVRAIDSLLETQKMYALRDRLLSPDGYPWQRSTMPILEFTTYYLKSRILFAERLLEAGNTAGAAHFYLSCAAPNVDPTMSEVDEVKALLQFSKHEELIRMRHPDFKTVHNRDVVFPELQLRGAWQRLYTRHGPRPRSRTGFASWVWKSKLYVFGGTNHGKETRNLSDIWCLDLKRMESWRCLPHYPASFSGYFPSTTDTKMCVWKDDAWLFFGNRTLFKFDMVHEEWSLVETKLNKGQWPYAENTLIEYCAEIFEGKLHIFGGVEKRSSPGINLHMALDLNSLRWTKIGGTIKPEQQLKDIPTLRKGAGSWVVPLERRMYILYGCASKPKIGKSGPSSASLIDHQQEDLWSYSFDDDKWTYERSRGNFPAPRARMACVYNATLNHVIVFGGCNSRFLTVDKEPTEESVPFTHFADTFVLDMKTRIWRQVLTHTLPRHRIFCAAAVDDATGKSYLYGGSCSSELVPSKIANEQSKSVSLGDFWQLHLDSLGGGFNRDQFEKKERLRRFGQWKLCFGCGEYKADIFACGGTCGGRIFLCSADCQKKCWREHRRLYFCRRF